VSSTAVTLAFSRQSRLKPARAPALGLGILAACTMLLPQVVAVTAVVAPLVAPSVLLLLLPPLVVGAGLLAVGAVRIRPRPGTVEGVERNPLRLGTAIQMRSPSRWCCW